MAELEQIKRAVEYAWAWLCVRFAEESSRLRRKEKEAVTVTVPAPKAPA